MLELCIFNRTPCSWEVPIFTRKVTVRDLHGYGKFRLDVKITHSSSIQMRAQMDTNGHYQWILLEQIDISN